MRDRIVIGLAALLAAVVLPLYALKVDRKLDYTDFEVYYRAAKRVQQGRWSEVYNLGDGASPFRYAPPLLPFFRPFAELTLPHARLSWYFIQYLWFALGFVFLERALRLTRVGHGRKGFAPKQSVFITALSLLFILRFCLDCFTIGQVSSLLFLGYCAGLWAWMARRPGAAGTAILVPASFKIGPGFLFSLFAGSAKPRERERAIGIPLLVIASATIFLRVWCGGWDRFKILWNAWVQIVVNDSVYYDASHYGSQSFKSALLRAVNSGWLSASHAYTIYVTLVVTGCLALLSFWVLRRARSPLGRGAFFALGIFPYLWFMPETFKYSLTTLAVPIALLLAQPRKSRTTWVALIFAALTISITGLDVVGHTVFFALQRASVPLVATLLLGFATFRLALSLSGPAWPEEERSSAPWPTSPNPGRSRELTLLVPLPMQSTSRLTPSWIRKLSTVMHRHLARTGESFEICLIPFGNRASRFHPAWLEAEKIASELTDVFLLPASSSPERGAALRDGFLASNGRFILCVNAEQPCEPEFYSRALELARSGEADLIRANRRHPESRFRIPVRYLSIVYGRHRMGLLFNRFVRTVLPIKTTDTHSGSWAMTREAAMPIFTLQKSPGFLFDLEAWITAATHELKQRDLPVTLFLSQEKSARRVGHEAWAILRGIPALSLRYRHGCYDPKAASPQKITADDWGITPGVNQGILELARLGIVRRVSLMAYGAYLREGLAELKTVPDMSLGLHFDLTYGKNSPGNILLTWLNPGKNRERLAGEARAELRNQLSILREAGVTPTHLDGHHHIHLVPGLLDALAPVILEAGIRSVRLPSDPALLWRKPSLWLLTRASRAAFKRHGFETLPCFYPQARHFRDQGWLRAQLRRQPQAEVIVHPASFNDLAALRIPDPYTTGRVTEYRALKMLAFTFESGEPGAPGEPSPLGRA